MDKTTEKIIKEIKIDCLIIWGVLGLGVAIYIILAISFTPM